MTRRGDEGHEAGSAAKDAKGTSRVILVRVQIGSGCGSGAQPAAGRRFGTTADPERVIVAVNRKPFVTLAIFVATSVVVIFAAACVFAILVAPAALGVLMADFIRA